MEPSLIKTFARELNELVETCRTVDVLKSQVQEMQKENKGLKRALSDLTNDHVKTVNQLKEELASVRESLRLAQRAVAREETRRQLHSHYNSDSETTLEPTVPETYQNQVPAPAQQVDEVDVALKNALLLREYEDILRTFHLRNDACPMQ